MSYPLSEKFIERMKNTLPLCEREAFFAVYDEKPIKGVRVNALKISGADYERISPISLTPVPWAENAYYTDEEKKALEKYFDILYGGFDESEE